MSRDSGTASEVLSGYRRLAELTRQMRVHARREEWGALPALEEQCSIVVMRLRELEPAADLDAAQLLEKLALLDRIQPDYDEVRAAVGPQLLHLRDTVLRMQRQRMLDCYQT